MAEVGVDLSREFPKPLTDDAVRAADVVITMGCGDACPVYPGKRYEDWDVADPAALDLQRVRVLRDGINDRVAALLENLISGEATPPQTASSRRSEPARFDEAEEGG
jgi:protein-tyrosine-phosphatase